MLMSHLSFPLLAMALAFLPAPALAARVAEDPMHNGTLVSITGDKLIMTGKEGQEHSHTMARDVKLSLDGKACTAAELLVGTEIRVTTKGADKKLAISIEGFLRNLNIASNRHEGRVVSLTRDKLVMTGQDGREHSHALTTNAKLTLDGVACKPADLKPGMRIRVTTEGADNNVVNRIEGLDKKPEFTRV